MQSHKQAIMAFGQRVSNSLFESIINPGAAMANPVTTDMVPNPFAVFEQNAGNGGSSSSSTDTLTNPFPRLERQRAVAFDLPDEEPPRLQRQAAGEPLAPDPMDEILETLRLLHTSAYPASVFRHTLIGVSDRLREYAVSHGNRYTYESYADALREAGTSDLSYITRSMVVNGVRAALRSGASAASV